MQHFRFRIYRKPSCTEERGTGKENQTPDMVAALSLATLVGLLGAFPHLLFAHSIGAFDFFHGAYDEATYTLGWMRGALRSTRLLSGLGFGATYLLGGFSIKAALVLSDFVFPFLAMLAAYFAASQIHGRLSGKMLIALLLVFGSDLFSLGNMTVWTSSELNISRFSGLVGHLGSNLVPPYETSYLAVYRTPEPQVSLSLIFVVLGLLARLASRADGATPGTALALIAATAALPFGYTFVTLPVALIAAGAAVLFVACKLWRPAAITAAGLAAAAATFLIVSLAQQAGSQSSAELATALSYSSRLPVVTPAVIASLILGSLFVVRMLRWRSGGPLALFALGCLLAPALISNQQIVTGVMISARDWERTSSYPILVFAAFTALSAPAPTFAERLPRWSNIAAGLLCFLAAIVVVRAQKHMIDLWMPYNAASAAAVRALSSIPDRDIKSSMTFEDAGLGPLVQLRMDGRPDILLDFYKLGIDLVPNMASNDTSAPPSRYEGMVFEYWLRTGTRPEQAEKLLREEIQRRAGMFSNYLFSFRDAWYPASDNRAVRQAELERTVEPIIGRYMEYLLPENRVAVLKRPSFLVSSQQRTSLQPNPWVRNEYIGRASAANATVYLYRQQHR